jgi:hypothetical protein
MKSFLFKIKWPPIKSHGLLILITISYFTISINSQCTNDCVLNPGGNKTFFGKVQTCLRLVCQQNNLIWKKNQDSIILGNIFYFVYQFVAINNRLFQKGGPANLIDPINFDFSFFGGETGPLALEILKLNSTDTGLNKYQASLKFTNGTESLKCNYNILAYGKYFRIIK